MFPSNYGHGSSGSPPLPTVLEGGHYDDVVVETHSRQQDEEPDQLEYLEFLPRQEERDQPDEESPHTIEHHACSRTQFFGYTYSGKVEESYTHNVSWKWATRKKKKKKQGKELEYKALTINYRDTWVFFSINIFHLFSLTYQLLLAESSSYFQFV